MKVLFFIEKSGGNFIELIDYLESYFLVRIGTIIQSMEYSLMI